MKITGTHELSAPVDQVWQAVLDPAVLVRAIPGCSRLVALPAAEGAAHTYAMTVTAGVAAIKGTYDGTCSLGDLVEHESLVLRLQGAGAPGTVDATVAVDFEDLGADGTRISYDAEATVGGMVGGVGQRMLASVSRRMAGEFFDGVGRAIDGVPATDSSPTRRQVVDGSAVFEAPAGAEAATAVGGDFVKGIAVGAGLVLLGVLAGRWSRR